MDDHVERYDVLHMDGKPTYTRQGFLRLSAKLTRSGVLTYHLPDGTVQKELRPDAEVKKEDSLNSFNWAPVTDLHPPEGMVTSKNASKYSVGHVAGKAIFAGQYVNGFLMITHQDTIDKIKSGKRKELSPGYTCRLEYTPGEHNGEKYDAIQRDIHYNHLAIGPSNWGRSGSEVAIRVDGDASVCYYDNNDKGDNSMSVKLNIDNIGYPIESAQEAYDRYVAKRDAEAADLVKERDELKSKLDAKDKELGEVSAKLQEAVSQEKLDSLIQERVDLETKARKVLGEDVELKGKSIRDIHNEVLAKLDYKAPEGAADTFIAGAFEAKVASFKDASGLNAIANNANDRRDSNDSDPVFNEEKMRQDRNEKYENMWKEPCSTSTEA